MQERQFGGNLKIPRSPFDGFRFHGRVPSLFEERDPFDDPLFTKLPSGCNANTPGEFYFRSRSREPVIEELGSDDEILPEENETDDATHANRNPLVEQPEDKIIDLEKNNDEHITSKNNHFKLGPQPDTHGVSFQRVTYGGVNGAYSTVTRRSGDCGMAMVERQQVDRTTGQATHMVSRGFKDKGHSITRTLDSDGKVETLQTLHKLNEDELFSFEQAWKGNVDRNFQTGGSDFIRDAGSSSSRSQLASWGGDPDPFRKQSVTDGGHNLDHSFLAQTFRARPKHVVTINIE